MTEINTVSRIRHYPGNKDIIINKDNKHKYGLYCFIGVGFGQTISRMMFFSSLQDAENKAKKLIETEYNLKSVITIFEFIETIHTEKLMNIIKDKYIVKDKEGNIIEDHTGNNIIINNITKVSPTEKKIRIKVPIDSRLRHECFKRDNYKCVECGRTKNDSILHADHIISVSQGGTDELDNLQTLCDTCNFNKSNKCWKTKEISEDNKNEPELEELTNDK